MLIAGPFALACLLFAMSDWKRRLPWALSMSLALPVTPAVPAGGQSLPAFVVIALIAVVVTGISWLRGREQLFDFPGSTLLAVFVGWCVVVTLAGPTFFAGIPVLSSSGGIDEQVLNPSRLDYTLSNAAQVLYLLVNALLICYLATRSKLSPHLLAPGLAGVAFLSLYRLGSDKLGLPFPAGQIDQGNYALIDDPTTYRLRGVFPEPSGLGISSVVTMVYAILMITQTRGRLRAFYVAMLAAATTNYSFAHSGTGLAGGVVMALLLVGYATYRAVSDGRSMLPFAIGSCAAIVVLLLLHREVHDFVVGGVQSKLGTGSYRSRSTADSFSLRLGLKTYGIGVGLGSNRPSSLWPMLWSCTGFVGLFSFLALLVRVISSAVPAARWRPIVFALIAEVVCKTFAGSTIADPVLIMCLGLAAHAALHHRPAVEVVPPRVVRRQRMAAATPSL